MKRLTVIFGISLLTLFLAGCDQPLGLGSRINIRGPQLTITSPKPVGDQESIAVGDLFMLEGTASTANTVVRMEILLQHYSQSEGLTNAQGRGWYYKSGWYFCRDDASAWKLYDASDYQEWEKPESPVSRPYWSESGNNLKWGLPILLRDLDPGDYFITVTVWDSVGNSEAGSTQKIKLNYDNKEPRFAVRSPLLKSITGNKDDPDYPKDVNGKYLFSEVWVYDPINKPFETYNYIDEWVSGPIDFSYDIENEMIGAYKLDFEFTNRYSSANPSGRKQYYSYEYTGSNLPQRGIFVDGPSPNAFYEKVGDAIRFPEPDPLSGVPYVPMLVVSKLTNGAGLTATKANGWFAWLPDADKPFADISFGYKVDPKSFDDTDPDKFGIPEIKYIMLNPTQLPII